ncbi:hypothetical protein Q8A67_025628 [Cirrhinus molitorella]|uniref:Uncharacterized protein n=1 Tax=Cirrhinus molitorella TaxID=172907 RepID=A0AA88NUU7_9TELE|nr:hypothetical protein Q8A67_025628 [Cirrhinus molitorella]
MVAPMTDNCSPQETPMPRLFTLGLKRQAQERQSQACLFQKCREYKPQASLRQRELKSVKPPQTSLVLKCSPQAAPMLQGNPVSECSPEGAPIPKSSPQAAPVIECTPQGAPRLFTVGLFIPTFSTRNFHVWAMTSGAKTSEISTKSSSMVHPLRGLNQECMHSSSSLCGGSRTLIPLPHNHGIQGNDFNQEHIHGSSSVRLLMALDHRHHIWGKELRGLTQECMHSSSPLCGGSRTIMALDHNHHIMPLRRHKRAY